MNKQTNGQHDKNYIQVPPDSMSEIQLTDLDHIMTAVERIFFIVMYRVICLADSFILFTEICTQKKLNIPR